MLLQIAPHRVILPGKQARSFEIVRPNSIKWQAEIILGGNKTMHLVDLGACGQKDEKQPEA